MDIRRALPADLPTVAEIYAREAREGHANFDREPRPIERDSDPSSEPVFDANASANTQHR